jgi:hypothetical protein
MLGSAPAVAPCLPHDAGQMRVSAENRKMPLCPARRALVIEPDATMILLRKLQIAVMALAAADAEGW